MIINSIEYHLAIKILRIKWFNDKKRIPFKYRKFKNEIILPNNNQNYAWYL